MSDIRLSINGVTSGQVKEAEIERALEGLAGKFTLRCADPGGAANLAGLGVGSTGVVSIDGETVVTGYVDETDVRYDKATHDVTIEGRDRSADLVDCSYVPGVFPNFWTNASPAQIASDIVEQYGVSISVEGGNLAPLPFFAIHVGEKAFAALDRLARLRQLLPTSDGKGGILLTTAGAGPSFSPLTLGVNCERGESKVSHKGRFSHYIVLGQGVGNDMIPPELSAGLRGDAYDLGVGRYRPLIIHSELSVQSNEDLIARARWEAARRAGRGRNETITKPGWHDDNGTLWVPNGTVQVTDKFAAVAGSMLVSAVKLTLGPGGEEAAITVTWPQAFEPMPLPALADYDPVLTGAGS